MNADEFKDFLNEEEKEEGSWDEDSWGTPYQELLCRKINANNKKPFSLGSKRVQYIERGPTRVDENDWYSNNHSISFIVKCEDEFFKIQAHPDSWTDEDFGSYMEVVKVNPIEKLIMVYEEC